MSAEPKTAERLDAAIRGQPPSTKEVHNMTERQTAGGLDFEAPARLTAQTSPLYDSLFNPVAIENTLEVAR